MSEIGFRAEVVAVSERVLSRMILGRLLSWELVDEFERVGIDLSGERGEYHTVVSDGPIFSSPLRLEHGQQVLRDGYWFSDVISNGGNL